MSRGDAKPGERPDPGVPLGEFPFPLTHESRYLTWIRNRSNYMAVRGLFDYTRALGVLLRGIVVNLLIFVPYLLLVSLAVAAAEFFEQPSGFVMTKVLLGVFVLWTVLFLVRTPFLRIARFKKARLTGSDSSVKERDRDERTFGAFVILIPAVAAIESLPVLLAKYHQLFHTGDRVLGWPAFASTAAFATLVLGLAPPLLSILRGGLVKTLAIVAIAALGLLAPLYFVLFVSDFIVFGPAIDWTVTGWPFKASLVLPLGILLALVVGVVKRSWRARDVGALFLLFALTSGLSVLLFTTDILIQDWTWTRDPSDEFLGRLREPGRLEELLAAEDPEDRLGGLRERIASHQAYLEDPSSHIGERTWNWLAKLQDTQEIRIATDSVVHPEELALLAEDAGLYPRFDEDFDKVAKKVGACDDKTDDCAPLARDINHLSSALATVVSVTEAASSRELASRLISLSADQVDELFLYSWNREGERPRPLLNLLGEPLFLHLEDWGVSFSIARLQLAEHFARAPGTSSGIARQMRAVDFWPKFHLVAMAAVVLWVVCSLTIDVNLTSVHGLYRDRLASAFLIGEDTEGEVDIEKDLDLMELSNHAEGSTAPYHLINVALNLQGSGNIGIRDRKSDFFIFSKRFIGGELTGYCRSETMERVFPQMDLATAMAISAAAASPNMGRVTSGALTAVMTLLNIRLGYWVPNPGKVEKREGEGRKRGFSFDEVFEGEQAEIEHRWQRLENPGERSFAKDDQGKRRPEATVEHDLVGIGYSGGGIRSATINLGITQALHQHGVFDHIDYMSTVSGGGYLGSSLSALMRRKSCPDAGGGTAPGGSAGTIGKKESAGQLFRWRVRPSALIRESLGRLNEESRLVNVSDGGHIENLAGIELLRRRCRYIILGDGEGDGKHHFGGLATLIRTARIDLSIEIEDIDIEALRLDEKGLSRLHWALGRIRYPGDEQRGYLLYLKSSLTGDEDEVITNYRNKHPTFPHETTADQMFSEGQFEAYRSLGQHIGEKVLAAGAEPMTKGDGSFAALQRWLEGLDSPGEARWTRVT